ncbi:MAG: helix-turn-helix domain-containing protein, partial [Armatimonadetes bacterium]|nr:helix-turn-helix domain-containing protein [Armatimonadota bacterium]
MLPAQPNQSLIDGLACLQALAGEARPLGVTELGRRLGLETTRVHRLLRTLAHLGLVRQNAARKYEVGPAIHVLSAQSMFASGLLRRALGPLEGLQTTGHAVALGVLWRDSVSYLYHREPGMNAAEALGRVGLFPADQSSIGLVLLAAQPDERLAGLWGGQQAEALLAELAETRAPAEARATLRWPSQTSISSIAAGELCGVPVIRSLIHLARTAGNRSSVRRSLTGGRYAARIASRLAAISSRAPS